VYDTVNHFGCNFACTRVQSTVVPCAADVDGLLHTACNAPKASPFLALDTHHHQHGSFFLVLQIYPGCPPVFHLIRQRRLRFFGHVARADPQQDQRRVTGASRRPPSHWRTPCGRPRTSWLRTITIRYDTRCYINVRSKADMSQLNLPPGTDN